MSAIVGVYYTDGKPVELANLEQMIDRLAHRGPDRAGVWQEGAVGLGHRMLSTTPESLREKLPLENPAANLVITADARIDNRDDLIGALDLTDDFYDEVTDSQLILAAYEKWGESCPEKLIGDFAFAVWDKKKQAFFCARDAMGIRPFYYYYSERLFAFASEIKSLLCLSEAPRRLNEVRVAYHLARFLEDKAITFYQDILRLPPAHSIVVSRKGIRLQRYWTVDVSRELRLNSDAAYAAVLREKFTEAVNRRLRCSDFSIGSLLSGGLDSSSIVCTARKLLKSREIKAETGRLHTFSAIFPSLPDEDLRVIDERSYISAVVDSDASSHYIHADRVSPLIDLERLFWHMDEAFFGPNLYIHWALYQAIHHQGIRVILDGIDGDSTISHGYEYLTALARAGRWRKLSKEAKALSKNLALHVTPRQIIWKCALKPLIPQAAMQTWRVLRGRPPQPVWGNTTAINTAFAERIELAERMRSLVNNNKPPRSPGAIHWGNITSGPILYAIELADKAAAAFSLEPRYPFCDRQLIELCVALPASQKLQRGRDRAVMRRAMEGVIPQAIQQRTSKADLSPNLKRKLLEYEQEALAQTILNPSPLIETYFNVAELKDAYHRYVSRPMQNEQEVAIVFGAVALDRWLRQSGLAP